MKPYLPNQPDLFEKGLVKSIETVRTCQTGISFLAHFIDLVQALRDHTITSDWIKELEKENQKRQELLSVKTLEALEAEWIFLWKKFPERRCRKDLIDIKHHFTRNKEPYSRSPYGQATFLFSEFKFKYECTECSDVFIKFIKENQEFHAACDENLYIEYIQTAIEYDIVYFWNRLCILESIYQYSHDEIREDQWLISGRWKKAKYQYWERASLISLPYILKLAQEDLWDRFAGNGIQNENNKYPIYLNTMYKFTRTACNSYLQCLLNYVRPILDNHQSKRTTTLTNKPTKKQLKEKEVVDLALAYWKEHPDAKHGDVYANYLQNSITKAPYKYEAWVKLIRKNKIDPRKPHQKTRRKEKKGR